MAYKAQGNLKKMFLVKKRKKVHLLYAVKYGISLKSTSQYKSINKFRINVLWYTSLTMLLYVMSVPLPGQCQVAPQIKV